MWFGFWSARLWWRPAYMHYILAVILCVLFAMGLCIGSTSITIGDLFSSFTDNNTIAHTIVWDIRLPRALLAVMIGWTLGLSGAAMQGVMRHALVEPGIFGAGPAAALGAVAVFYFDGLSVSPWLLPLAGMLGAFVSVLILFLLMRVSHLSTFTLILGGFAISHFCAAATALLLNLAPSPFALGEIVFWLMGSLENRSLSHVLLVLPFCLLASAILLSLGRYYRQLALGHEIAYSLGVPLHFAIFSTLLAAACGVGAAVSVCGTIGFVGLIAPYMMRPFAAYDPQKILLPSGMFGACLLLLADNVIRMMPTRGELKLGVVMALIGVPLFIFLMIRRPRLQMEQSW